MEDEVRRQEVKRKTAPGGRKPKRRKLEKLVGWGEPQLSQITWKLFLRLDLA